MRSAAPTIAVQTALHHSDPEHLMEAYEALAAAEVSWEWFLRTDGDRDQDPPPEEILADPRVSWAVNNAHLGAPITRNLLLASHSHEWIFALDHDDRPLPGGLERLLELGLKAPEAGVIIGRMLELRSDGWRDRPDPYPEGAVSWQSVERQYRETGRHLIPINASLWRRGSIVRAGGWPAAHGSDDTWLMFRVIRQSGAIHTFTPVVAWRRSPKQLSQRADYAALRAAGRSLLNEMMLDWREEDGLEITSEHRQPPEVPPKSVDPETGLEEYV